MQNLQLTIPEPCHENWQQMTPTEQGRFCNACAKEVIDFSTMTDTQVLNYFTKLTHEKVCGRALPEQLDRTISLPEQPKKRLFWYWNYIVMFFMFFTKGNNANAQTCTKPATEVSPVDNPGIRGQIVAIAGKRIITGKVTDVNGNPVSFASIKIKGTNTGINADANGAYSLKVNSQSILVITGASFKDTEVVVGSQTVLNTVMEKGGIDIKEVVVAYAGGISYRNMDEYYGRQDKLNRVAVLEVKDEITGKPVPDASIIIKPGNKKTTDTARADKKGIYKIKGIKDGDEYAIMISAAGYEPNEFTIDEYDFKDRKKNWEVLLRKQKVETTKALFKKSSTETTIRLGTDFASDKNSEGLFIVDGIIKPNGADINPDDVEDYTVLQGAAAVALFGPDATNGAVVVTTRKTKVKDLKEVVVTSDFGVKRKKSMTGLVIVVKNSEDKISERLTPEITKEETIKIYPNPVQHGEQFSIALKLQQGGFYKLQITDITGRIILQKQISANSKEHTEKLVAESRWGTGTYYISITDNKNQLISKAGFIVQ